MAFSVEKQFKVLLDLAYFIEENKYDVMSSHFHKLQKYHEYLKDSQDSSMQKLHKEFFKVKKMDYQFQVYLMLLERLCGQSKKDYQFLVKTDDQVKSQKTIPIICLLDSIRSAHNVGAMIRNAECFGCEKIIMSGLTPTADHHQVQKTAMGTNKYIESEYFHSANECVELYKNKGYKIYAIETSNQAKSLNQLPDYYQGGPALLIFGHEHFGVSLELIELSDEIISIPLYGRKNSLNVSISQAISLQEFSKLN